MVDTQAKKIRLWAEDGDRQDPETVGLDRAEGWPADYEQFGSGETPERTVFNQLFRELTGWARDVMGRGVLLWDAEIDYPVGAFVVANDDSLSPVRVLYVAVAASGPSTGGAVVPVTDDMVWRRY